MSDPPPARFYGMIHVCSREATALVAAFVYCALFYGNQVPCSLRKKVEASLEEYANFTVFNQNLFEIDPYEIHNVTVSETIKDGITTYKA